MRFELVGKPTVDKPDTPSLAAANDRKPGYEGAMQGPLAPATTPGPFRLTGRCRGSGSFMPGTDTVTEPRNPSYTTPGDLPSSSTSPAITRPAT